MAEQVKPSEIIDRALSDYIPDEEHWIQGQLRGFNDSPGARRARYCMTGAMLMATHAIPFYPINPKSPYYVARTAVAGVIYKITNDYNAARFNDTRTYDEVRMVMEQARDDLREKGL